MTKLYYTPGSCAAASFIAAFVAGVNIQAEQVDLRTHKTTSGEDFYKINRKGNVPTLVLDDGTVLNEGAAILQWIADQAPNTVAPVNGTTGRYLVQNALNLTSSEIHSSFGALFAPNSEEVKNAFRARAAQKLTSLENNAIGDKQFLVGDSFTIADSYLYIVLSWHKYESIAIDLTPYPRVKAYYERIGNLPKVKAAHERMATNPSTTI